MITKQQLIKLNNEFDSNLLIKDIKKYNNVKSYIDEDADNPKVKYYLFLLPYQRKSILTSHYIDHSMSKYPTFDKMILSIHCHH